MDITSVLGLIVAIACTIYGMIMSGGVKNFYDLPSIYITIGGTIGVMILSTPLSELKKIFKVIKIAYTEKKDDAISAINQIVDLSYTARREGLLALENKADELDNEFLKKGILLVVDGMSGEMIRDVLEVEINELEKRHKKTRTMFDIGSIMAPAFGMIGTLIGLINMLTDLTSPDRLGPRMAVALVTTFYGSILANVIFIPISTKLKTKTEVEVNIREMMIEGILAIQAGENTRFVEQKLMSYLEPKERQRLIEEKQKGEKNE